MAHLLLVLDGMLLATGRIYTLSPIIEEILLDKCFAYPMLNQQE